MKIITDENYQMVLTEVYVPIILETQAGEKLSICMRDSGFEFFYGGQMYEAKNGLINASITVKPIDFITPRFRVIGDLPNNLLPLNHIIVGAKAKIFKNDSTEFDLASFPNLFKRLDWWEERELHEMPRYVSNYHIKDGYHMLGEHRVWKVLTSFIDLGHNCNPMLRIDDKDEYPASYFIPSTKEEYLAYVNLKNNLDVI